MKRSRWLRAVMTAFIGGSVMSAGCSDVLRRSVRDGVFTFVSGNVGNTLFSGGALNNLVGDLLTGGFIPGIGNQNSGN